MSWSGRTARSGRLRPRILCVDDEPVILHVLRRILEPQQIDVVTCGEPVSALAAFDSTTFDLVVTDIHMPGMDGLALMRALRGRDPEIPVVVVTGHGSVDVAIQALREGASGMLVKPFTAEELLSELQHALAAAQMRYEALQFRFLSPVLDSVALTLSTAIEARNLETAEHCRQLGVLSERMAREIGMTDRERMTVRIGGYLHDIGKIGIPDAILLKPGRLTDSEMAEMRRHSAIGAAILEVHEAMASIADIVRHHHERWDGLGYPGRLAGAAIPIGARIIAVADAFNAMTSDRVYRSALPLERAWAELHAHAGTQFDPDIVDAFERVVDERGALRPLPQEAVGDSLASGEAADTADPLDSEAFAPVHDAAASLPTLASLSSVRASLSIPPSPVAALVDEPCAAAPEGEACAVVGSGEGCEIVPEPAGSFVGPGPVERTGRPNC